MLTIRSVWREIIGRWELKWLLPSPLRRGIRKFIPGLTPTHLQDVNKRIYASVRGRVLTGPFRGMEYTDDSAGSALSPKLLGTYEKELSCVIEAACFRAYGLIIVIGAAEGYYAVGMALKSPQAHVIAFEQSEIARRLLRRLIDRNRVSERISIDKTCSIENLATVLNGEGRKLVICDVDGAEVDLLDPIRVTGLRRVDVLVELHDCFTPGISAEIEKRFAGSHFIDVIKARPRRSWDCPKGLGLTGRDGSLAVQEHRPGPQSWFWMRARTSP
jgi:hypothetical protein